MGFRLWQSLKTVWKWWLNIGRLSVRPVEGSGSKSGGRSPAHETQRSSVSSVSGPTFDRGKYHREYMREYMRGYMRRYRKRKRET
jgi:hypothetical protein